MKIHTKLILSLPLLLAAGVASAEPVPLSAPVNLGFSVIGEDDPTDPGITQVGEDGCGKVAYLDVTEIPAFSEDSRLATANEIEIDSKGRELRRWRVPNSYLIQSLDGDWALAAYAGKESPLWIHTSGKLGQPTPEEAALATGDNSGVMMATTCPSQGDKQCLSVRDRPARTRRIIATDGVCS